VILADTSVWIDHYRYTNDKLVGLLHSGQIIIHDLIIEELACGNLAERDQTLRFLSNLPKVAASSHNEIMELIRLKKLYGTGIGSTDAHLIASCLFAQMDLFTLDKNLAKAWELCRP
jgi:predicted nucleic acid-binding protein